MAAHEPTIVVEQNLGRHPAEVPEGALQTLKPALLALIPESPHMHPAREAERRHEQEHLRRNASDQDPPFPEVDLELVTRRGLEAHRRSRLARQLPPKSRHLPLDRPQAQRNALLGQKLLAHHIGIPAVSAEAFGQPALKTGQRTRPPYRTAIRHVPARRHIATDRHVAAPKLARDPLDPPTQRLQPQHRRDLVRRPHLVSPQDLRLRHRLTSAQIHLDPPGSVIQRVHFLLSSGVQFYMSPDSLIPGFDGAVSTPEWKDALWARFSMGAPPRQRRSVERYSIVKRA